MIDQQVIAEIGNGNGDPPEARYIDVGRRLRAARERANFRSGTAFARKVSVHIGTYLAQEAGTRKVSKEQEARYCEALGLHPGAILFGDTLPAGRLIPIVNPTSKLTGDNRTDDVQAVDLTGLLIFLVTTDENEPVYRQGESVLHRPLRTDWNSSPSEVHGKDYVLLLSAGETVIRRVMFQQDGSVMLIAYNAPPTLAPRIVAAAPVEIVLRDHHPGI